MLFMHIPGSSCIQWIKNQPGCFVTSGDKTGLLRTWTVSQKQSTGSVKVYFISLSVFVEPSFEFCENNTSRSARILARFNAYFYGFIDGIW